jgi:hypothetical protein
MLVIQNVNSPLTHPMLLLLYLITIQFTTSQCLRVFILLLKLMAVRA